MKINIFVEGIEVEGKITYRSASDISVQITKPFSNISKGLHIPNIARAYSSFDGEKGDTTAESLLKNLYDVGQYLDMEIFSRVVCKKKMVLLLLLCVITEILREEF